MAKKKIFMSATAASAVIASSLVHAQSVDAASYTVKPGDTLWSISKQHQTTISQLKSWNNLSSDLIYPNQVLQINKSSTSTKTTKTSSSSSTAKAASSSKTSTYTVAKGDTLSKIAAKHGISLTNLMKWNKLSTTLIYPGDKLYVSNPSSSVSNTSKNTQTKTTQTATAQTKSNQQSNQATYTVKSGDTLSKIASRHGVSVANLKQWNNLKSDLIYPGDRLVVSKPNSNSSSQSKSSTQAKNNNSSSSTKTSTSTNNKTTNSSQTYTVKAGDNLSKIAAAHGLSLNELKALNNISSHVIYPGDVLIVSKNSATNNNNSSNTKQAPANETSKNVSSLLDIAKSALGAQYAWAGASLTSGFDCSGFIYWAFNEAGHNISRLSTEGYYNRSYIVNKPQVGDLVFFENTYKSGISHMGIYLGNNQFIHAGTSTGVTIASLNSSYWQKHFHSFKRFY